MTKLGFLDILKLILYEHTVKQAGYKIKQTEWNACFDWYLEAFLETMLLS